VDSKQLIVQYPNSEAVNRKNRWTRTPQATVHLSVQDMKRFGVDSVTAPPAYPSTDVSGFGQHILFIELDDARESSRSVVF
jgi:hypothetical protein